MSIEQLRAAMRAYRAADRAVGRAEQSLTAARTKRAELKRQVADAITDAADAGEPQKLIVEETGYTRERVRQIVNAAHARAAHATTEETP